MYRFLTAAGDGRTRDFALVLGRANGWAALGGKDDEFGMINMVSERENGLLSHKMRMSMLRVNSL